MGLIIALLLAGMLFIGAEALLPSGIIAALGGLCLAGGVITAINEYGALGGLVAGVCGLLGSAAVVIAVLQLLPRTNTGRKFYNQSASDGLAVDTGAATDSELIGKAGRAVTAFAPTGLAEIDGRQYEASCLDGFLHPGDALIVAGRDNYKLLVKKV